MKQTAVEFLSEKYMYVTWLTNRDEITSSDADRMRIKYFEEAKEMEKQQIIDAYDQDLYGGLSGHRKFENGEHYYNETFNK
jgi:hypothetical protein